MNFKLNFKTEGRPNSMGRFQVLHQSPVRGVALRCRLFPASQMLIFDGVGLQIRHNAKYTVLVFFPHHRCSYSMVSDCKSDTTTQMKIRHNDATTPQQQRHNATTDTTQICPVSIHQYIKKP